MSDKRQGIECYETFEALFNHYDGDGIFLIPTGSTVGYRSFGKVRSMMIIFENGTAVGFGKVPDILKHKGGPAT